MVLRSFRTSTDTDRASKLGANLADMPTLHERAKEVFLSALSYAPADRAVYVAESHFPDNRGAHSSGRHWPAVFGPRALWLVGAVVERMVLSRPGRVHL